VLQSELRDRHVRGRTPPTEVRKPLPASRNYALSRTAYNMRTMPDVLRAVFLHVSHGVRQTTYEMVHGRSWLPCKGAQSMREPDAGSTRTSGSQRSAGRQWLAPTRHQPLTRAVPAAVHLCLEPTQTKRRFMLTSQVLDRSFHSRVPHRGSVNPAPLGDGEARSLRLTDAVFTWGSVSIW
jgi:hypothetical protein